VTADPRTVNSAPRRALCASLAASTPLTGVSRHRHPLNGPQTGAQSLEARRAPAWAHTQPADKEAA
jgi:hypothetical protein